jgi:hypothetical protein
MEWYTKITQNLANLPDFVSYYEDELQKAKYDTSVKGNIEKNLAALPGITEQRFNQLQEIEAVLNYLNIQLRKTRSTAFKKYLENYNRALSSRDAERYCDSEADVVDMETLCNEVALLRNKWLGIIKALESKNFMLGHITRIRIAGMESMEI